MMADLNMDKTECVYKNHTDDSFPCPELIQNVSSERTGFCVKYKQLLYALRNEDSLVERCDACKKDISTAEAIENMPNLLHGSAK